jgi:hypothetical protein
MSETELSKTDYNICIMAVRKCHLLWKAVKAGLPLVPLTERNFGFVDMSDEEEHELFMKLYNNAQIAWLKEQR